VAPVDAGRRRADGLAVASRPSGAAQASPRVRTVSAHPLDLRPWGRPCLAASSADVMKEASALTSQSRKTTVKPTSTPGPCIASAWLATMRPSGRIGAQRTPPSRCAR